MRARTAGTFLALGALLAACAGPSRGSTGDPAPEPTATTAAQAAARTAAETTAAPAADTAARAAETPERAAPRPPGPAYVLVPPTEVSEAITARGAALVARGESLPPGEVGYYVDVQEARFRQVATSGVAVARLADRVILSLPGALTFDVGSASLSPLAARALDRVARVLVEFRFSVVSVHGHTDASGDSLQNVRLSEQRALAVAQHLISAGVAPERIVVAGYGSNAPIAPNDTPEGRNLNRRVELQLDPLTE